MESELASVRLLYLDADADSAETLATQLASTGLDVTHLPGGKGALSFLAGQGFDVVLLGRGEEETLFDLHSMEDAPPVVCLTDGDCSVALNLLEHGADDFVTFRSDKQFASLLALVLGRAVETGRLRTENRIARQEAEAARKKSDALLHEMQHRIANSLALVVSMVHLQAGRTKEADTRAPIAALAERISAVAQVHKGLYDSPTIGAVELNTYLAQLIRELEGSFAGRKCLTKITYEGIALSVRVDQAISLGVIVSELVGNAARYAYPRKAKGAVRVRLAKAEDMLVELTVEDDGIGLPQDFDENTGLGSQLITVLAKGLAGEVQFESASTGENRGGARAVLRFPSPE